MWTNKRHGKKKFQGNYVWDSKGERNFLLTEVTDATPRRRITFESWQAAMKLGWVKA